MAKKLKVKRDQVWKDGPLPPGTWNWGGVVLKDMASGFYFADFHGDHVTLVPSGRRVEAEEVLMYNNSLELPPQNEPQATRLEN